MFFVAILAFSSSFQLRKILTLPAFLTTEGKTEFVYSAVFERCHMTLSFCKVCVTLQNVQIFFDSY